MKAKISIILSDDSCRELLTNFGLESAEELKTMLKICFGNKRALLKQEPTDALFFIGTGQQVEDFAKQVRELETYKDEYRLAAAANKQLSDALDKAREENKMLRLQMFAFVRNSAVLPVGRCLNKSEQEITDKTFETIEAAKAMLDVEAVKELMNLASNKENRYDI